MVAADTGRVPPTLTQVLTGVGGLLDPVGDLGRVRSIAAKAPSGVIDLGDLDPVTWHPLGGATLGTACDMFGRVQGHPGLYVTDGALVPGSTGACNPTWTIAALAERCLDDVLARDF